MTCLGILAAVGLMALGGCATTEKGDVAMGAINDQCPMSGRPVDPEAPTVEHAGSTIGFCCGGCVGPWEQMTKAEKDGFVAKYE
jgi:hypothetical protein